MRQKGRCPECKWWHEQECRWCPHFEPRGSSKGRCGNCASWAELGSDNGARWGSCSASGFEHRTEYDGCEKYVAASKPKELEITAGTCETCQHWEEFQGAGIGGWGACHLWVDEMRDSHTCDHHLPRPTKKESTQ